MTSNRITLESFEGPDSATPNESEEYKRGVADGAETASQSQAAVVADAVKGIASTLNDMAFGYEEARHHLQQNLHALLSQLSEAILPEMARQTFGAHLIDVIETKFSSDAATPIEIAVAPDVISSLGDAMKNERFVFVADPDLSTDQALIRQNSNHVLLDLPALLAELQTALNGLEPSERNHSYG